MNRVKIENLLRKGHDLHCTASMEGSFTWLSKGWEPLLGHSLERLRVKPFFDFIHPDDIAATVTTFQRITEGARLMTPFQNRYLCKNGDYVWLEWYQCEFDPNDQLIYASAKDITKLKEAYNELDEGRRLLELTTEFAQIGHWRIDSAGRQFEISKPVYEILGLDPEETTPGIRNLARFLHPKDISNVISTIQTAFENYERFDFETRIQTAAGNEREIYTLAEFDLDDATADVNIVGIVQDVTERNQARRELEEAARLKSLANLAAGIAHEINNPLTYVMGSVDVLKQRLQQLPNISAEDVQDLVTLAEAAVSGTETVRKIIRGLRSYAKKLNPNPRPVSVGEAVDSALAILNGSTGIPHRVDVERTEVPQVLASFAELEQVLVNLISNASRALTEYPAQSGLILIRYRSRQQHILISVEDNGPGIDEVDSKKIFAPFWSDNSEGLGLGLALCQRLVTTMNGRIWHEKSDLGGARFVIELPEVIASQEPVPRPELIRDYRGEVLVIDDDARVSEAVERMLSPNYTVVTLQEPLDTLPLLQQSQDFDLILCDIAMPTLNGEHLYYQVRDQIPKYAERFVFMTGDAFNETTRAFLDREQIPFIEKPFTRDEILTLTRDLSPPPAAATSTPST